MPFNPITRSSNPESPLANPNAPLSAENEGGGSLAPILHLPLHLQIYNCSKGTVSYRRERDKIIWRSPLNNGVTNETLEVPGSFKADEYIVTNLSRQISTHPLNFYIPALPTALSLNVNKYNTPLSGLYSSARCITSSLEGTFEPPFQGSLSFTDTKTTTQETELWPYRNSFNETIFAPLKLKHQSEVNFRTIPNSERDPTNNDVVEISREHLTENKFILQLKISIPPKLNRHPDMCFSILFKERVIWQYYPHSDTQNDRLANILVRRNSDFVITNSGYFNNRYSLHQLIQNQHRSPCTRSHSNIRKIKFHLTMKPDLNNSLTITTNIKIQFEHRLPNLLKLLSDRNGVAWKSYSNRQETQYATDLDMERYYVTHHKDTHSVISGYKNPSSSPLSSALSPPVLRQKSNSKYEADDSDAPSLKRARISRSESSKRNISLIGSEPQIPWNERQAFPLHRQDADLNGFFESNDPSDLSLNSPSPPNFDFPPTDDPLKKLLQLLNSPDGTRSPSSGRLEPIFSSDLFDENSK